MNNLSFSPRPIDTPPIRLGEGSNIRSVIGRIQRAAAVRAYAAFEGGRDWIDKISSAYVVALATRSADTLLMRRIQEDLGHTLSIACSECRKASIGESVIRERLFPELKRLREHANDLIHHLDHLESRGVAGLDIESVFAYCHHLFHENADALFGLIPDPTGKFPFAKCKKCQTQR